MKDQTLYLLIGLVFIFLFVLFISKEDEEEFSKEDQKSGEKALKELEKILSSGKHIPELSEEELNKLSENILLAKVPLEGRENMKLFRTENTRYWPQWYYSQPYNPESGGGAWPPGMYTRLRFWSPGFYTGTGWSYYLRPGMGYKFWPRNRWIRNVTNGKNSYYYLGQGDEYIHYENQTSKAATGLDFLGG